MSTTSAALVQAPSSSDKWKTRVPASFWQLKIPSRPLRTLGALLHYANDCGECFPSIDELAARTGTDRTNIYRDLRDLRDRHKVLTWTERKTAKGFDTSHKFQILLPEFVKTRDESVTPDTGESVTRNNRSVTGNALTTSELPKEGKEAVAKKGRASHAAAAAKAPLLDDDEIRELVEDYNETRTDNPLMPEIIGRIDAKRRRALSNLIHDIGWDGWTLFVQQLAEACYLKRKGPDFDWCIRVPNARKIMNGNYDIDHTGQYLSDYEQYQKEIEEQRTFSLMRSFSQSRPMKDITPTRKAG
jgi:hypothetical protein